MYEVQQCELYQDKSNPWVTWDDMEGEKPKVFDSVEDAQAEIDEFFDNIHKDILNGDRCCDDYFRDEFIIVEIDDFAAIAA